MLLSLVRTLLANLRGYAYMAIPIALGVVGAIVYFISVGRTLQQKDDLQAQVKQIKKAQKIEKDINRMSGKSVRDRMLSKWSRGS